MLLSSCPKIQLHLLHFTGSLLLKLSSMTKTKFPNMGRDDSPPPSKSAPKKSRSRDTPSKTYRPKVRYSEPKQSRPKERGIVIRDQSSIPTHSRTQAKSQGKGKEKATAPDSSSSDSSSSHQDMDKDDAIYTSKIFKKVRRIAKEASGLVLPQDSRPTSPQVPTNSCLEVKEHDD